jgi:competence protein ComFC
MSLLDFIFPKYCINCRRIGSYICDNCFSYISFNEISTCAVCQKAALGGLTHPRCSRRFTIDGVISSLVYKGVVKKMVYQFKYKPHVSDLQSTLDSLFYEGLIQKELFHTMVTGEVVFVPIPLHKTRFRSRGYNQSLLLAESLSKQCGIGVVDCMERVKNTTTQIRLSQQERKKNISGAFVVKNSWHPVRNVILIDDIVTSGATLTEATKVLKKAGVEKVWGATLAHGK